MYCSQSFASFKLRGLVHEPQKELGMTWTISAVTAAHELCMAQLRWPWAPMVQGEVSGLSGGKPVGPCRYGLPGNLGVHVKVRNDDERLA